MVFYEVPKPVEMVHSWKRIGASNEFEPDFSSDAGKSYMRGVMGIAGAYIAVGILLFIIYSISNCAAVCCYGKPRPKSKENKGGCCAWVFSARIWYFIATLVVCALAAAGLSQVSAFKAATMQTFDAVQDFTGILTTTSETVANGLVPNMNGLTASLTQFKNAAVATGNPALASNLDSVIAASTAASSASMAFSGQINGTTGDIDDQTTGDHSVQNKYLSKVWIAGLACLALFLGFMLLTLFGLLSTKGACVYFGLCQALLVCVVLGVFIFSGIFAAVSIVAADVCVAPSQSINSMLSVVTTDPTVLGTVSYYTTCGNSSAGVVPPSGAYAMVVNGSVGLQTARYALDALEGNATVMAVYGPYVQWSQGNLSAANGTMQTVWTPSAARPCTASTKTSWTRSARRVASPSSPCGASGLPSASSSPSSPSQRPASAARTPATCSTTWTPRWAPCTTYTPPARTRPRCCQAPTLSCHPAAQLPTRRAPPSPTGPPSKCANASSGGRGQRAVTRAAARMSN